MRASTPQQIPRAYGFKRAWPRYIEPEGLAAGRNDELRRKRHRRQCWPLCAVQTPGHLGNILTPSTAQSYCAVATTTCKGDRNGHSGDMEFQRAGGGHSRQ